MRHSLGASGGFLDKIKEGIIRLKLTFVIYCFAILDFVANQLLSVCFYHSST
jgi:hypothetical protein